jgi:hypothetical protein
MRDSTLTTIRITKSLREELAALGSKKETYDAVIRRLLDRAGAKK